MKKSQISHYCAMFFQMTFSLASHSSSSPSLLKLPTTKGQHRGCKTGPTVYSRCTKRLESLISLCGCLLQGSTFSLFSVILSPIVLQLVRVGFEKRNHPRNSANRAKLVADGVLVFLASLAVSFTVAFLSNRKILTVIRGVNFCREEFIVSFGEA